MTNKYFLIWYDRNKSQATKVEEFATWDEAIAAHHIAILAETRDGPSVSLVGAKDRAALEQQFYAFFHKGVANK